MIPDILVIGGGPAGLMAAIAASESRRSSIVLLESNARPGRKFLLSGSGRCNVTRGGAVTGFPDRYGGLAKARFVKPALFSFDNTEVIRFFEERNVPLLEREDGKIFPRSLKSGDLLESLLCELDRGGVDLRLETAARTVKKEGELFHVETGSRSFQARRLILATGGRSYPGTGSTGSGWQWAKDLGHDIVPPRPALAPVIVRDYPLGDLAGISFPETTIELYRHGKRIRKADGDVLLTHRGLSGPGILDLSRYVEPEDVVRLALCSRLREKELQKFLAGKKTVKNALDPLGIPDRLLTRLLELLDIPLDRSSSEITRDQRRRLEETLLRFPFPVLALGGWNEAMATSGGVDLSGVNRKTMESRLVPGLFFCGEILDVDGDTGGYNIQFALSSGHLAGRSAVAEQDFNDRPLS